MRSYHVSLSCSAIMQSYHASGKAGMLSRIVNPLLGGQIVFCNDRYNEASTMEQLHLRMSCEAIDCIKKMI